MPFMGLPSVSSSPIVKPHRGDATALDRRSPSRLLIQLGRPSPRPLGGRPGARGTRISRRRTAVRGLVWPSASGAPKGPAGGLSSYRPWQRDSSSSASRPSARPAVPCWCSPDPHRTAPEGGSMPIWRSAQAGNSTPFELSPTAVRIVCTAGGGDADDQRSTIREPGGRSPVTA